MKKLIGVMLAVGCVVGCSTVSDKQAELMAQTAKEYYNQPKVAEIWSITSKAGNGRVVFENFDTFTLNTPVPPVSIMPKDPSTLETIGDTVKSAVPYVAGAYLLHGNIGRGNTTVNNNAAQ